MLSSLLQQKNLPEKDSLTVDISYTNEIPDGEPTTQEVIDYFREKGLIIFETKLNENQIPNRSIARNKQVTFAMNLGHSENYRSPTHMLFADSDMVYAEDFFSDLIEQLDTNLKGETKVMGADRVSLKPDYCIDYFEKNDKNTYPCVIEDAAAQVSQWPVWRTTGAEVAPGNFQLASMSSIISHGAVYTKRNNDVWRRTRSDRGFRIQLGGRIGIKTKPQYHLNHGRELGVQR